jgi:hypothetical protein
MIAAERRLVAEANGPDGSVSEQVQHPTDRGGAQMITEETIACSPAAWRTKHGDRGDVPLADDVQFTGPVASFDSADGFRRLGARGWRGRDRLRGFARSSSTATPSPRSLVAAPGRAPLVTFVPVARSAAREDLACLSVDDRACAALVWPSERSTSLMGRAR